MSNEDYMPFSSEEADMWEVEQRLDQMEKQIEEIMDLLVTLRENEATDNG